MCKDVHSTVNNKWKNLSNVKGFHSEDVNAACLKVVPEVIGRDHQHHLTGVAFLSIQLDKHIGV